MTQHCDGHNKDWFPKSPVLGFVGGEREQIHQLYKKATVGQCTPFNKGSVQEAQQVESQGQKMGFPSTSLLFQSSSRVMILKHRCSLSFPSSSLSECLLTQGYNGMKATTVPFLFAIRLFLIYFVESGKNCSPRWCHMHDSNHLVPGSGTPVMRHQAYLAHDLPTPCIFVCLCLQMHIGDIHICAHIHVQFRGQLPLLFSRSC